MQKERPGWQLNRAKSLKKPHQETAGETRHPRLLPQLRIKDAPPAPTGPAGAPLDVPVSRAAPEPDLASWECQTRDELPPPHQHLSSAFMAAYRAGGWMETGLGATKREALTGGAARSSSPCLPPALVPCLRAGLAHVTLSGRLWMRAWPCLSAVSSNLKISVGVAIELASLLASQNLKKRAPSQGRARRRSP
jgi:hypothetical protein